MYLSFYISANTYSYHLPSCDVIYIVYYSLNIYFVHPHLFIFLFHSCLSFPINYFSSSTVNSVAEFIFLEKMINIYYIILFFILHFINCKPFMFGIKSMTYFPLLKGGPRKSGIKVTVFPLLNFFPALKTDIKCFAMHGRATTGQFT